MSEIKSVSDDKKIRVNKNIVSTSITSDKIRAYGLNKLAYPERPLFQQLLAIHTLLLKSYETIFSDLKSFIATLEMEDSAAFEQWITSKSNVTSETVINQLALSFAYFLYHGFDEQNRLNFEIKFINALSEFETLHFHRDTTGLSKFYQEFFNMIVWEFQFGNVFEKKISIKTEVDKERFKEGLEKFYDSDDFKYEEHFEGMLDGKKYPEMTALASHPTYRSMVPRMHSNFSVSDSNLEQFNCRIKEQNYDPNKITFDAQLLHHYVEHRHGGDHDAAHAAMGRTLRGTGSLADVKSFRGYLPIHDNSRMQSMMKDDYQEYLDEMEQKGMDSPIELFNPLNIISSHKYGDEASEANKKKYYDEIAKGEQSYADEDDSFQANIPTFLKPSYQYNKFTSKDIKEIKKERDELYAALVRCNADRAKYLKKRKQLVDTNSFEDVVKEGEEGSTTSFSCHFNGNSSDEIHIHAGLFEAPLINKFNRPSVDSFKETLVELYGKDKLTQYEMESRKYDVKMFLALMNDNGPDKIMQLVYLIFMNMYQNKMEMLGLTQQIQVDEKNLITTLPYHKELITLKEKSGRELAEKRNSAYKENDEPYIVEDDDVEPDLAIQEDQSMHKYGKTYDISDHVSSLSTKEVNVKMLLDKQPIVDEDGNPLLDVDGKPEMLTTVKIPKSLNVGEYASFILSIFKGGKTKEGQNRLVVFAQRILSSMSSVIGQMVDKVQSVGGDLPGTITKIKNIIGQLDVIRGPIKDYAIQVVQSIPNLVKFDKINQGLEKVLSFLTTVLGQIMQAVPKVFNYVIENKQIWNTALNVIKGVGTYAPKAISLISDGGSKISTQIIPVATKALGSVGTSTKLLTTVGNMAGSAVTTMVKF